MPEGKERGFDWRPIAVIGGLAALGYGGHRLYEYFAKPAPEPPEPPVPPEEEVHLKVLNASVELGEVGPAPTHWHEFDPLTEHVWDPLTRNRCVKAHLPRLYTRLYGTPGYVAFVDQQKYQTLIELYHEHYEKLVMEDGISRPGGHTHYPFVDVKPAGQQAS